MADYTGGYTSALNDQTMRELRQVEAEQRREETKEKRITFGQQQEALRDKLLARMMTGSAIDEFANAGGGGGGPPGAGGPPPGGAFPMLTPPPPTAVPPGGMPPPGAQAPPPGASSMPMRPPMSMPPPAAPPGAPMPPGAGQGAPMLGMPPPGGPPPVAMPGMAPGAPGAGPMPGMPPGGGAPAGGPPMTGWKGVPSAPPGGGMPGQLQPPPGAAGDGSVAVLPKQMVSVKDISAILKKKGISGKLALDMLDEWKPYMDDDNKRQLESMKVQNQALTAALRAYEGTIKYLETARHNRAMEGSVQERVEIARAKLRKAGNGEAQLSPEDRESIAAQVATGESITQVVPGWGNAAVGARRQARQDAIKLIMDETGDSAADAGRELAQRSIDFTSGRSSSMQLTKMQGATRQAVGQLDFNVAKATEEMKKLPSTDLSPVLNALVRGVEKWTGAPEYASLFYYMQGAAMESARLQSGGQASVAQLHEGARKEAQEWANINLTIPMWDSVSKAMKLEGRARLRQFQDAIDAQRSSTTGTKARPPQGIPATYVDSGQFSTKGEKVWWDPSDHSKMMTE